MKLVAAIALLASSATAAAAAPYPYQSCFELAARTHELPVDLILAVAATESNWDPDARSHANAHGIMQIQWPGTAKHLGVKRVAELYNPCLNINLGARYLRELIDRNQGNVDRALASYNYGPTRIDQASSMPAGAQRYIATVNRHRARVGHDPGAATVRFATMLYFDSGLRARRFARSLDKRVASANFAATRVADGRYGVAMTTAGAMSRADRDMLETVGWPIATTGAGR